MCGHALVLNKPNPQLWVNSRTERASLALVGNTCERYTPNNKAAPSGVTPHVAASAPLVQLASEDKRVVKRLHNPSTMENVLLLVGKAELLLLSLKWHNTSKTQSPALMGDGRGCCWKLLATTLHIGSCRMMVNYYIWGADAVAKSTYSSRAALFRVALPSHMGRGYKRICKYCQSQKIPSRWPYLPGHPTIAAKKLKSK